jgi:LacI family transcriptional regulator, galactose operon repressor
MANVSRRTTITDVARSARVSIQTVSAVFHDKPGISEPTRERVRRIIQRLHYEPNGLASSLRAQRSLTVGVLIPSITNPFFPDFVRGIEDVAHLHRYSVFLCNSDQDQEKETQYLQLLRRHDVAGYVVAYDLSNLEVEKILTQLSARQTPIVTFGSRQRHAKVNVIEADDEDGSFRITSHLIKLGHRRIALIQAPAKGTVNLNRTRGYIRALKNARIRVNDSYIVPGGFTVPDGQRGTEQLMAVSPAPTAVVAANDLVAIGAISALKRLGKQVPGDVSVVGFDNIQMSELVDPPLTTISQPTYEMGKRAMEALLEQIDQPGVPGKVIHFETPLIVRESTDIPKALPRNKNRSNTNEKSSSPHVLHQPARLPSPKRASASRR